MIDAWEIVGRMLTDSPFKDTLFATAKSGPYKMTVTSRVRIPQADFDNLRTAVAAKVKGPVSLAALGEMLIAMRIPGFKTTLDALASLIAGTGINTAARTPQFYQALGVSMIDKNVRPAGPSTLSATGFALDSSEAADITTIAGNAAIAAKAMDFCNSCWDGGCQLRATPWPDHVHPVETPFSSTLSL